MEEGLDKLAWHSPLNQWMHVIIIIVIYVFVCCDVLCEMKMSFQVIV